MECSRAVDEAAEGYALLRVVRHYLSRGAGAGTVDEAREETLRAVGEFCERYEREHFPRGKLKAEG